MSSPGFKGFDKVAYPTISSELTNQYEPQLSALQRDVATLLPLERSLKFTALLPSPTHYGHAEDLEGIVSLSTAVLEHPTALFIAIHEGVHIRLSNSVARTVESLAPGYLARFQDTIFEQGQNGKLKLTANDSYLSFKGWRGLYPGFWQGTDRCTWHGGRITVARYFGKIARGDFHATEVLPSETSIRVTGSNIYNLFDLPGWLSEAPDIQNYPGGTQWLAHLMVTGYQLNDFLHVINKVQASRRLGSNFHVWEEGVANYIASEVSGVTLERAQLSFPQDDENIDAAHLMRKAKVPIDELMEVTTDRANFEAFLSSNLDLLSSN